MTKNELLKNLDKIHTTELGVDRIKKNLELKKQELEEDFLDKKNYDLRHDDIVSYCKDKIKSPNAIIERKGKNWYVTIDDAIITVNASSYTIITAHKIKKNNPNNKRNLYDLNR